MFARDDAPARHSGPFGVGDRIVFEVEEISGSGHPSRISAVYHAFTDDRREAVQRPVRGDGFLSPSSYGSSVSRRDAVRLSRVQASRHTSRLLMSRPLSSAATEAFEVGGLDGGGGDEVASSPPDEVAVDQEERRAQPNTLLHQVLRPQCVEDDGKSLQRVETPLAGYGRPMSRMSNFTNFSQLNEQKDEDPKQDASESFLGNIRRKWWKMKGLFTPGLRREPG